MKTEWDYTLLADAYLERPDYAPDALQKLFSIAGLKNGDKICDVGAGVAHLTIPLALAGYNVDAVEPNDAMRANGIKRTVQFKNVNWFEGTGEDTGRPIGEYDFVCFGSSFSVCDRSKALKETYRLLKSGKYFCCLWNHRDLEDPIQKSIENIIKKHISEYSYGTRREDQRAIITESGLFKDIKNVEGIVYHKQNVENVIKAWGSHATLERQSSGKFNIIIA